MNNLKRGIRYGDMHSLVPLYDIQISDSSLLISDSIIYQIKKTFIHVKAKYFNTPKFPIDTFFQIHQIMEIKEKYKTNWFSFKLVYTKYVYKMFSKYIKTECDIVHNNLKWL